MRAKTIKRPCSASGALGPIKPRKRITSKRAVGLQAERTRFAGRRLKFLDQRYMVPHGQKDACRQELVLLRATKPDSGWQKEDWLAAASRVVCKFRDAAKAIPQGQAQPLARTPEFLPDSLLGYGTYGHVYSCALSTSSTLAAIGAERVAVKCIPKRFEGSEPGKDEARVLHRLAGCDTIVRLHAHRESPFDVRLIFPLYDCNLGVISKECPDEQHCALVVHNLLIAANYMARHDVLHRDT